MLKLILAGFLLLGSRALVEGCGRGSIYIQNNGYKQVLVAIGHNVTENPQLVLRIKEVFRDASRFLYQVTRQRAFLDEITILIPTTWPDKPEYLPAGRETIDKSDILVDEPDRRYDHGHRPFVLKNTDCGELGHYMHVTPDYLLDRKVADQYGPYDKVMIHEWSHLRYGVYNEYAGETGRHFYANGAGEIEATRCSSTLRGTWFNRRTGSDRCAYRGNLPEPDCRYRDQSGISGKYGSIMYKTNLNHIVEFCDNNPADRDTLHNAEAPTLQNIHCEGRSVWEVLRSHPDFERTNLPRNISNVDPTFRVVRPKNTGRSILVLDVSGSMGPDYGNSIVKLGQACSNYITSIIRDEEQLGIVWFNGTGMPIRDLTVIDSNTRRLLLQSIPRLARGATSIGGGIREGLKMLRRGGGTMGGQLIVVSDGEENRAPWISDVWDETVNSNVTVHSIAITDEADSRVDALAQATGGLSFLYSARDRSNALNEAFQAIGDLNQNPADRPYTLVSRADTIRRRQSVTDVISIDMSLGRDTEFVFDYAGNDVEVVIHAPGGVRYDRNSPECTRDVTFGIYRFRLPGVIQRGKWWYNITNTLANQRVAVSVTSRAAVSGQHPVIAQAFWARRNMDLIVPGRQPNRQALFASVSQGQAPVLYADVLAMVERPGSAPAREVTLLDNGAGADKIKDDGIYSAYFVHINANGRYNVKIAVNSTPATVVKPRRIIGQGAPRGLDGILLIEDPDIPLSDLQRTASGGSFELEKYQTVPGGKFYPPGRITDLRVEGSNYHLRQVNLVWTAVGAQLDTDQASYYELRYGRDFKSMKDNFEGQLEVNQSQVVSGGRLDRPRAAGETEDYVITVPERGPDVTYYFGVKAVDMAGRQVKGDLSTVTMASLRDLPNMSRAPGLASLPGVLLAASLITWAVATRSL